MKSSAKAAHFPMMFALEPSSSLDIDNKAPRMPRASLRCRTYAQWISRLVAFPSDFCRKNTIPASSVLLGLGFPHTGTREPVSLCVIRPAKELQMSARRKGALMCAPHRGKPSPLLCLGLSSGSFIKFHKAPHCLQGEGKCSRRLASSRDLPLDRAARLFHSSHSSLPLGEGV